MWENYRKNWPKPTLYKSISLIYINLDRLWMKLSVILNYLYIGGGEESAKKWQSITAGSVAGLKRANIACHHLWTAPYCLMIVHLKTLLYILTLTTPEHSFTPPHHKHGCAKCHQLPNCGLSHVLLTQLKRGGPAYCKGGRSKQRSSTEWGWNISRLLGCFAWK